MRTSSGRVARAGTGAVRTRRTAASVQAQDLIDVEKYNYFKNNRGTLPASIGEHSAQITALMKAGKSAEDAFNEVVSQHY